LNDGTVAASIIDRYEKVVGFSRHAFDPSIGDVEVPEGGGGFGEVEIDSAVISACSIPGLTQDDLYMVVRREIDSEQVQYMETLEPRFLRKAKADAWFVDCGGQYSGAAVNEVTGVDWLEGEEVDILADGAKVPRQIVTDGSFSLPGTMTASKITFGLPIVNEGGLLPPPVQAPDGSSFGRKMRVVNCLVNAYESLGLKLLSDRGTAESVKFRKPSDPMDASSPLITGKCRTGVDGSWASNGEIGWTVDGPLPGCVLSFNIGLDFEP
jgi:hypothetical protein